MYVHCSFVRLEMKMSKKRFDQTIILIDFFLIALRPILPPNENAIYVVSTYKSVCHILFRKEVFYFFHFIKAKDLPQCKVAFDH